MFLDQALHTGGSQAAGDRSLQIRDDQSLPTALQNLGERAQHLAAREVHAVQRLGVDDQVEDPVPRPLPEAQSTEAELLHLPGIGEMKPGVHSDDHRVWALFAFRKVPHVAPILLNLATHSQVWEGNVMQCLKRREGEAGHKAFLHGEGQGHDERGEHDQELARTGAQGHPELMDVDKRNGSLHDNWGHARQRHLADRRQEDVHRQQHHHGRDRTSKQRCCTKHDVHGGSGKTNRHRVTRHECRRDVGEPQRKQILVGIVLVSILCSKFSANRNALQEADDGYNDCGLHKMRTTEQLLIGPTAGQCKYEAPSVDLTDKAYSLNSSLTVRPSPDSSKCHRQECREIREQLHCLERTRSLLCGEPTPNRVFLPLLCTPGALPIFQGQEHCKRRAAQGNGGTMDLPCVSGQ
mmetsp:Transcript_148072/g.369155  ORF Transcript_148072/g.369155 Transcript_148072/m.369155 type:complete len:408 (-) Transcript_148072:748-1971(-)